MNVNVAQNNNINNINNNIIKRASLKDNKQLQHRQNLNSAFAAVGKLSNGNQNPYGVNNNWVPPTSNIWSSTSYSEVVAKPIEPVKVNQNFGTMNGMMNGVGHRHPDHDLIRMSSYSRFEECSQYGPIGTKKSPSSTPSWEPLTAGMNHHSQLAKPSPFNSNSSYFSPPAQPGYGMQQSKLMNLMSYNDTTNVQAQQLQQQQQQLQQQQQIEEQYRQYMMKMEEQQRQQVEWMNASAATSSSNLWSPAYRRNESPTSQTPSWSSPSPPLAVPPGFEQQFQQPTNAQQNHQNVAASQAIPAYDPFKSLSVIWEPKRNDTERDTWNQ
jgi:hypothetical protein